MRCGAKKTNTRSGGAAISVVNSSLAIAGEPQSNTAEDDRETPRPDTPPGLEKIGEKRATNLETCAEVSHERAAGFIALRRRAPRRQGRGGCAAPARWPAERGLRSCPQTQFAHRRSFAGCTPGCSRRPARSRFAAR